MLPFINHKRLKEITVLLKNGEVPILAGYELLKYKSFNFDVGVGTKYTGIGLSKDITKNITVGPYLLDTYKNIFSGRVKPKYGIGIGIKF